MRLPAIAAIAALAACGHEAANGGPGALCYHDEDCDEDAGLWCGGSEGTEGTGTCEDDPLGDQWADCKSDDECEEGLVCVLPTNATPNDKGFCSNPS